MTKRLSQLERQTLISDSLRQGVDGLLESLRTSVFLLVVINYFSAPDWQSSLISQAFFFGLLLSLVITPALEQKPRKAGLVLFLLSAPAGIFLMISSFSISGLMYSLAVTLSGTMLALRIPFITGIYSDNYAPERRGRLLSLGMMVMLSISILGNYIFGELLDKNLNSFRVIHFICGLLVLLNGIQLLKIPGNIHPQEKREPFWHSLKLLWQKPIFGWVILLWFILGFANLWAQPLRTVYLGDPIRGLGLNPSQVLLILGVIPGVTKLVFNFIWGHLYDRLSFVVNRMLINLFLVGGIFIFFQTRELPWIILGSVLMHIALAGSPYIWNLWVMKIAPPEETRKYMSVHSFMCGLRGVLGPMVAFAYIRQYSIQTVGWISGMMGIVATLMLLPLLQKKYRF